MSPIRCRSVSTFVPQRISPAGDAAPEAVAFHEVWSAAQSVSGAEPPAAADQRRAANGTLVVPRQAVADLGARLGSFSLRETMRFGVPASIASGGPSAAARAPGNASAEPRCLEQALDRSLEQEERKSSPPAVARPPVPPRAPRAPAPAPQATDDAAARGDGVASDAAGRMGGSASAGALPSPLHGSLFRAAAVDARRADATAPELGAPVKARSWSLLLLIASLIALSSVGAALASVEVTAEAQGVLRAPNGLRPVAASLAGSVTEVLVRSGDVVETGQVIARLEATELRASLAARERELELVRDDVARAERHDALLEAESARALQRRRAALRDRIEVNAERREQRRARDENLTSLVQEGGASRAEGLAAKEALQDATELVSSLGNELAQLDLEVADRARQAQERESTRRTQLGRAEAGVAEARTLLAASEIHAPAAGRIESLLVSPGAVISVGGVLGNIVPSGAPRTITGFVPSREIAFVQPGAPASVELQSLSVSEFGLAKARVTRVSSDLATTSEVQAALNEAPSGSLVRVELELVDSDNGAKMEPLLRSGEHVKIRLHRRERRLITLLFDFVRRWVS